MGNSTDLMKILKNNNIPVILWGARHYYHTTRDYIKHFIFDARTGNRINYSRKIKIDDHVWIGQNSILLSGFSIGEDSIIGTGSISSSLFPAKVVIARNPARVVREGVSWHRSMTWTADYHNIDEIT